MISTIAFTVAVVWSAASCSVKRGRSWWRKGSAGQLLRQLVHVIPASWARSSTSRRCWGSAWSWSSKTTPSDSSRARRGFRAPVRPAEAGRDPAVGLKHAMRLGMG